MPRGFRAEKITGGPVVSTRFGEGNFASESVEGDHRFRAQPAMAILMDATRFSCLMASMISISFSG